MFHLASKDRLRISQQGVVRQAVPDLGSGDWEGSNANYIQFDWWYNKTVGASRTRCLLTREINDAEEWTKVRWRASM